MIIKDPFKNKTDLQKETINKILDEDIPKKIKGRNQGFGEDWNQEKEEALQDWLDKISNKHQFNFRLVYASTESLFPEDFMKAIIYG